MLNIKRFKKGIKVEPTTTLESDAKGEIEVDNGSGKLNYHDGSGRSPVVTESSTATLTNKSVDADTNTISNIEVDNFKASAIDLDDTLATADDTKIPTSLTVKNYVASQIQTKDEASEIGYDNATSGLTATNVQTAIDEVEGRLDTAETSITTNATDISNHLSDATDAHDASAISYINTTSGLTATDVQGAIDEVEGRLDTVETDAGAAQTDINNHIANTTDAHDASAISNVPAGNLAATDVQGALNELQSDVDTRALNSDLTTHTSASTNVHGLSGGAAVVGTTSTQTLTNKTIQGASIESPTRLDVKKDTKANLETYATTATDGQLCFATDEKIMYQVVDNALTEVGSGSGVGSVDIMFADQFDSTAIADYTTTGTVALTEDVLEVLQGKKSLEILHTGGASAERTIPVDIKFRGKNVTLSLDVASDALSGNLTLTVTDETNTVTLINAESIQPQEAGQTSVKRSVSFNIPSDCEEISYLFNAVSESGVTSIIDNVVIELTETARLSTTIEVPVMTDWVDAGVLQITATTTSPTKGTAAVDKVFVRRNGTNMDVRFEYRQTTGGTDGSGDYLFGVPSSFGSYSGLQIDTTKVTPYSTVEGAGQWTANNVVGNSSISNTSTNGEGGVIVYDSTRVRIGNIFSSGGSHGQGIVGSAHFQLSNTAVRYTASFSVPILGWEATETQSVSLAQTVLVQESDSALRINRVLGYGSTNTRVVRFDPTGITDNTGDAVTYIPSATLGDSFKINKKGIYNISCTVGFQTTTGSAYPFIVKNPTNVNQSTGSSIPIEEVLVHAYPHGGASGNPDIHMSATVELEVDDVIWVTNPVASPVALQTDNRSHFEITYQGKLKQLNVSENQKIEIPTSELRMEGASTRGATATAIVRFDNIAKLRGDAFTVESDATLGTRITMKKKGLLSISSNLLGGSTASFGISKNQTTLTTNSLPSNEVLSFSNPTAGTGETVAYTGFVDIGDILRVFSGASPTANNGNNLNLSFQEQEVSVSVTNVLPQFSESDTFYELRGFSALSSSPSTGVRYSSVLNSTGSSVSYTDSATEGATFEILENGTYSVSATVLRVGASMGELFITKNELTTLAGLSQSNNIIARASANSNTLDTQSNTAATQAYLQKGDKIRVQLIRSSGLPISNSFTISKVGKPNVTGVDVTPFAKIEYEVKDEVQANTHAGYGATNTRIPYYTNITKNTNRGLIRVENSATLGFSITVLKACELTIESTHVAGSNVAHGLTVNSAQLSTSIFSINPPERLTIAYTSFSDVNQSVLASYTGFFQAGDVIRPHTATAQAPGSTNRCNISVVATELRDAYQVIGGGVENTYSARITSAAAITSQSYPFIESISKGGTGIYNIVFKAGFFTQAPSVVPTVDTNAGNAALGITSSITTSGCTVTTVNVSDVAVDKPFNLTVTRQGGDYRTPSKAIGLPAQRVAVIKDVKTAASTQQTLTGAVWNTRVLNNLVDPTGIVTSLASNQIVLPAGKYFISARSPVYSGVSATSFHKAALYNVTDASYVLIGTTERTLSPSGSAHSGNSVVEGHFTLTATKTLDIRHYVSTTHTGDAPPNTSTDEIYTTVVITKIEE